MMRLITSCAICLAMQQPVESEDKPAADASGADERDLPAQDGWAASRCAFTLAQPQSIAPLVIKGQVPAFSSVPFAPTVRVLVDGKEVRKAVLAAGDFEVRSLIVGNSGTHRIELQFDATRQLPLPDGRMVAAQIRSVTFERITAAPESWRIGGSSDVVTGDGGVGLGAGWYPFESWQGQRFRWAGTDAEICIVAEHAGIMTIEVEAGPGIAGSAGTLKVVDRDGHMLDTVPLGKRQSVDMAISAAALGHQPFHLVVAGGGKAIAGDARTLDLRVFSIAYHAQP